MDDKPHITAKLGRHALHPALRLLAAAYFVAACFCDFLYSEASAFARAQSPEFAGITEWLLVAGLVTALLTGVAALADVIGEPRFRALPDSTMFAAGWALLIALELCNLDLRWAVGADAIPAGGFLLSLAAMAVLVATPSHAWARMYR